MPLAIYSSPLESDGHKPQIRVNQALWTIESVAREQGLSSPQIVHLMDYVAGRGKGSELHCWSLVTMCLPSFFHPFSLDLSLSYSLIPCFSQTLPLAAGQYAVSFPILQSPIMPC